MKRAFLLLILCASCTFRKGASEEAAKVGASGKIAPTAQALAVNAKLEAAKAIEKASEKEILKILHWFEQMDSIYRESLWVIRKEKAPQDKSIFGKMQRALLTDLKQKLANKSVFKCDVYSMKRNVMGITGVPQSAEVYHQCNSKQSFVQIGDWDHNKSDELTMNFRGGNLEEILGFATSILSPRISCKLKSNENGIIENFSCENMMVDYNPAKNQVLKFTKFEYLRASKNMLHIKAEVLENLDPVRKIEVDVPMEGKIKVTETVLQATEYLAKEVPAAPVAPAAPAGATASKANPEMNQENPNEQNQQVPQTRGTRKAPAQQQAPQNPQEGFQDGFDNENQVRGADQGFPQDSFPPGVQPQQQQQEQEPQYESQQGNQAPTTYFDQYGRQIEAPVAQPTPTPKTKDIPRDQNTR